MPRKKVTIKETTKKETTQKKKTAQAPKKTAATKAAEKATTAKAVKKVKTTKAAQVSETAKATKVAKASRTAKKPKSTDHIEKRKHLRLHYSRLISFIHYNSKNHVDMPSGMAAIQDLSHTGILIETAAIFKRGDSLGMDIAFEEDRIIPAQGEVIHLRKTNGVLCKAGVKFTKIKKKDLTYLKGFVDGRLAKE